MGMEQYTNYVFGNTIQWLQTNLWLMSCLFVIFTASVHQVNFKRITKGHGVVVYWSIFAIPAVIILVYSLIGSGISWDLFMWFVMVNCIFVILGCIMVAIPVILSIISHKTLKEQIDELNE